MEKGCAIMCAGDCSVVRLIVFCMIWTLICCFAVQSVHADGDIPAEDGMLAAISLAVAGHPSAQNRRMELQALGYDLESAESLRYPTFSLQASSSSNLLGVSSSSTGDQYQTVVAVMRQPLWAGGRIDGGIDQATARMKIGKLSLLIVQRQLIENTAAAYVTVLGARSRYSAADLNVKEHERLKVLIARRAAGGIASQADIQLASSRLSQAAAQAIQLEGTLERALNDLQALTLVRLPAMAIVDEGMFGALPGDTVTAAEEVSATILQKKLEVVLARTASDLATANMLPSLYGKVEQDIYSRTSYGSQSQGTRVGIVFEGTLEGFGLSGWKRVKSSTARVDAARSEVEAARNEVRRQVRGLLTDLRNLQAIVNSNQQLVTSTEETLNSFMRQYDAGRKSWVDVLNAQRELSDARLSLVQSRSSLLETRARLAVQLGQFDQLAGVQP